MRAAILMLGAVALLALGGCASRKPPAIPETPGLAHEQTEAPIAESPTVREIDVAAFETITTGTVHAFSSPNAGWIFIPIESVPEAFDPATIAPAEIVALARADAAIDDRWLPTRRLERVGLDDPTAAIRAVVIPRESLGNRTSIRVADAREVTIRAAPLSGASPTPLADSFARFRPALLDPSLRWRARLALDPFGVRNAGERFPDDAVEAYALALELRVRAAIDSIRSFDPALADRLVATLGRTLTFPGGVIAPAWPEADATLEDILRVVLDESVDRPVAADRVRQWLDARPRAVAWIENDAGLLGTKALVAELVGVADLISARVAPTDSCDPSTLLPILARTVAEVELKCRTRPSGRIIHLRVGDWAASLDAIAAPASVAPPGLRVGPLMLPHSMRSLLASQIVLPDSAHATAALIQRKPSSADWQIYAECLSPRSERDAEPALPDVLRFHFGSRESPRATLELRRDATSTLTTFGTNGAPSSIAVSASVREDDDRWVVFADIPPDAYEPDGTLIVGVERIDARGVRSVWPRPVLPWEDTPSRIAMDPSTWPQLGPK